MAVFKCKMCGGALEISEGMTVCECEYCGTTQTLPKTNNEQHLNLINRANHFRQQCEFDKAAEIYEKIAAQSDGDAEIYWSLVLCRYGIEYVDDPATKKKIPTCHRTQFRSILDDPDYQSALQYADMMQRNVYQSEAEYIDKVQKSILEISNKEKPFDIFICYKETDEHGRRTPDSVLAQELYYGLVQEGFKVFFSRITLESKLGTEYEPYIFAALNSAKVMVVVGTKPEYFNAVWVKNEWSRYLMLMQEDRKRTLIPAYKDMDPYDLPDALSMFQAQDMSKLGFMQDLIRGIRKIAKNELEVTERPVVQQTVVHTAASSNIENLLKRGYLSLEDGKWDDAQRFFDEVLNENVEEYRAYIGLLCMEYGISDESKLADVQFNIGRNKTLYGSGFKTDNEAIGFIASDYYKKACRFGGAEIERRLYGYYLQGNYNRAVSMMNNATSVAQVSEIQKLFSELGDYMDSSEKIQECEELKLKIRYNDAVRALNNAHTENECIGARNVFVSLSDYNDSQQKIQECNEKIEYIEKDNIYNEAKNQLNGYAEDVNKAITLFESISDFKDSVSMIQKCRDRLEEFAEAERKRKTQEKNEKNEIINTIIGAVVALVILGVAIVIGKFV